jgi:beta-lactamase superfamily II metal-dependent hydrolase
MAPEGTRIDVRMYNVGFGDAFRVTVRRGDRTWRMLVDCGVHFLSTSRPIEESVDNIIADLTADCAPDPPRLDVVVGTHRHQDHVSGFRSERWRDVEVDEVWLPYVENDDDDDAIALAETVSLRTSAQELTSLISSRREAPQLNAAAEKALSLAFDLASNSTEDSEAMDRLLEQHGSGFARPVANRRFLPDKKTENNRITVADFGIVAHILGPSRDPAMIKKMRPPANAGWFTLAGDAVVDPSLEGPAPLFDASFVLQTPPSELTRDAQQLRLDALALDDDALLAAASLLDKSINNTSLFFVLEVGGLKFLFPGDAQVGAWNHVRQAPKWRALVGDVAFYKVGHHGSHNATSPTFVDAEWKPDGGDAMVPWRRVDRWKKIPYEPLMKDLARQGHRIIKPEPDGEDLEDRPGGGTLTRDPDGWWSQLTFET